MRNPGRYFEALFRTRLWRTVSILLLAGLVLLALHLGIYIWEEYRFIAYLHTGRLDSVNEALAEIYFWGAIAVCIILALMLAVLLDLRRASANAWRYARVSDTILRFSAGDHRARVTFDAREEHEAGSLAKVAESFNYMAGTLEKNIVELERTDRYRRELVSYLAHDLGTPLTAIRGYAETALDRLKSGKVEETKVRSCLDIILSNSAYLGDLVAALSDLAKLDQVGFSIQTEAFSLGTLLNDVTSRFAPEAKDHAIRLRVNIGPHLLMRGDISLMERVITNLIQNALVYTDAGGSISAEAHREGQSLSLTVSDTGCGIPREDLPHIFECFYRVESHRPRRRGGTGLGLAFVKRAVDAHGGRISVLSEVGQGTRITIWIPAASH